MQMLDPALVSRNLTTSSGAASGTSATHSGELPDLLLIERARAGDEQAVQALVRRYVPRLYRVAWSVLLDGARAETAVLEACTAAFGDLGRYEPSGKFAAWLTRLTYNEARALRGGPASAASASKEPTGQANGLERIVALPEPFRTVYVLRAIEGISGIETAASLNLHETTVRTRLYRAHRRVAAHAGEAGPVSPAILEPSAEFIGRLSERLHHGSLRSGASRP
jgi:RNA polymerase sigma-70 factor (ECF subfamily)